MLTPSPVIDCGFNSKTTFSRCFIKHTGISPKLCRKYRKKIIPSWKMVLVTVISIFGTDRHIAIMHNLWLFYRNIFEETTF